MKKISIVGFGRFGRTLYRLIKDDFTIVLYNKNSIALGDIELSKNTNVTQDVQKVYESDVIFYAVPISTFETVIMSHKKYIKPHHVLIDVLSVKMHPARIFTFYLANTESQILLTHPMFGPDSAQNSFEGLPIILTQFRIDEKEYLYWKTYFENKKLRVIEMSAEEHDRIAANTQGVTHFIGRLLEEYDFKKTQIDSLGTKKLLEIKEQTCNDTWQLFSDLQQYNPYTKKMRLRLGQAYDTVYNKLLPKQVDPAQITFGIQGGKGSFNEEAIFHFLKTAHVPAYTVKYLYTSKQVLEALHIGEIDVGQFAIHNSVGGIVEESIEAMAAYKFNIIGQFAIKISHALMIRADTDFSEITTIMSHSQVFAQCKQTLLKKYPQLEQASGNGDLIDHAMVAKHLSENRLPKNVATMGSKILAEIYNLKIIEDNLQDAQENYTSFLQVSRI